MEQSKQFILCVDDDNDTCELVKVMFRPTGYRVTICSTANKGLLRAQEDNFAAIILDNRFKDADGVEICREIRSSGKHTPIIFFTTEARPKEKQKALDAGANAYLIKPNDLDVLTETVVKLVQNYQKDRLFRNNV